MKKQAELYDPAEYVALKKNALKYIDGEAVKALFSELQKIISNALSGVPDKISPADWARVDNNEQAIKKLLKTRYKSAYDEVLQQLKIMAESDWQYRFIYAGFAGLKDTEEETYFYWLTHQAKHSNEVEYREVLKRGISTKLREEKQLTKPENDWLIYVLEKVDVPHESNGAPKRSRDVINRQYALAEFILNDETEYPTAKIKKRLERAANTLCTSFETVRADYYSAGYKKTYEIRSKLQIEN